MEKFRFEYEIEGIKHSLEVIEEAITIGDIVDQFKNFLRGLYSDKLVDEIRVIGPGCQ